jgi:hypothetical protein
MQINLTTPKDVINVARPSLISLGTHSIVGVLEVNGLAIDASALDKLIPAFELFKAFDFRTT